MMAYLPHSVSMQTECSNFQSHYIVCKCSAMLRCHPVGNFRKQAFPPARKTDVHLFACIVTFERPMGCAAQGALVVWL